MSVVDMVSPETDVPVEEEKSGRGRRKLVVLLVVAVAAAAGWWFMLRPAAADAPPEPGAVLKLDAIQVNLAGGHYLRIGIALQASKDAGTDLDGSEALDATIDLFSGQSMDRLADGQYRNRLKAGLERKLDKLYDGKVIGVYLTDFVTQ